MEPSRRLLFALLNTVVMPWWLAMILLPRSRVTAWLMRRVPVVLAVLGASYVGLAARALGTGAMDGMDADAVRRALTVPDMFLAGWAHHVAFDLFVGRWIWRTALAEGRGCRVALLLTLLVGPAGLTLFMAQRRMRPSSASAGASAL